MNTKCFLMAEGEFLAHKSLLIYGISAALKTTMHTETKTETAKEVLIFSKVRQPL